MIVAGPIEVVNKVLKKHPDLKNVVKFICDKWQCSRNLPLRVVIVRNPVNSFAYMEPNEIKAIMIDHPNWRIDFFTVLNFERQQHFQFVKERFDEWTQHREKIDEVCKANWRLPRHISYLIADFAEDEQKMCQIVEKDLADHWASNDDLDLICVNCTIYKDQPIIKIVDATNEYINSHDQSGKHLHAVEMADTYYDELEPWAVYEEDDDEDNDDEDILIRNAF